VKQTCAFFLLCVSLLICGCTPSVTVYETDSFLVGQHLLTVTYPAEQHTQLQSFRTQIPSDLSQQQTMQWISTHIKIPNCLINLGGWVYAIGEHNEVSWNVALSDPADRVTPVLSIASQDVYIITSPFQKGTLTAVGAGLQDCMRALEKYPLVESTAGIIRIDQHTVSVSTALAPVCTLLDPSFTLRPLQLG